MSTRFTPEYLTLWSLPRDYSGAEWEGYYSAGVGQSRDSQPLERSNFRSVVRALEAIPTPADWAHDEPPFTVVRESHWAVGWVEWVAVHPEATACLRRADDIQRGLEDYAIVDESDFCEEETNECAETWENCYSPKERLEYLRRYCKGQAWRDILAAVRGDWYSAANILPSPSDLIY